MVQELLTEVPAGLRSETPEPGLALVRSLGTEAGLTPLHLAAMAGNENAMRLLLNSPGAQTDAVTNLNVS